MTNKSDSSKGYFLADKSSNNLLASLSAFLLIFGVWALVRPYGGIRHDAVLYTGQALFTLNPEVFARDLFFAFGSQTDYSLYPWLLGRLFLKLGVGSANMLLMAVAAILFVASTLFLFGKMLPRRYLWLGLGVLAVFPHSFGAHQAFAFAEPFMTARSLAEPIGLLALVSLLSGSSLVFFGLAFAALLVHPLIAIPVLFVGILVLAQEDRRWIVAAVVVCCVALSLALMGIKPFGLLIQPFEEGWLNSLTEFPTLFLRNWILDDWNVLAFDLLVLYLASTSLNGRAQSMVRAVALVAVGGVLATALFADLLHWILPTQLQLWRAQWLGHCFALALLPWVVSRLGKGGLDLVAGAMCVALVAISYPISAVATALAVAFYLGRKWLPELEQSQRRWLWIFILVLTVLATLFPALDAWWFILEKSNWGLLKQMGAFLSVPLVGFGFVWMGLKLINTRHLWMSLVIGALTFSMGSVLWDNREGGFAEAAEDGPWLTRPFGDKIGPYDQVFWFDQLVATWVVLKNPSFFSALQCGGAVFSPLTGRECAIRSAAFFPFYTSSGRCTDIAGSEGENRSCINDPKNIRDVCKSFPQLRFVILDNELAGWAEDQWKFVHPENGNLRSFYLYRCEFVRKQLLP